MHEWFKERLEQEKQRKESDDSRIFNSYQTYSIVGAIIVYILKQIGKLQNWDTGLLFGLVIVSGFFWGLSIYFWRKAYYGHTYQREVKPSVISNYKQQLVSQGKTKAEIEKELEEYRQEIVSDVLESFSIVNDTRAILFSKANKYLFYSFIIAILGVLSSFMDVLFAGSK